MLYFLFLEFDKIFSNLDSAYLNKFNDYFIHL